jgi:hypothetical protein
MLLYSNDPHNRPFITRYVVLFVRDLVSSCMDYYTMDDTCVGSITLRNYLQGRGQIECGSVQR